uniref:XK-related protein n=1 Tax=Wuchereria bancrofti TaxID=6293 RepID=A0AAF5PHD0_WUCBA
MRETDNEDPLRNKSDGTTHFWKYPVKRGIKFEDDAFKDCTDRLPQKLTVRNFDIFCFIFSAASYLADIGSDATVAYIHYCEHRMWAFIFIAVLTVLPSLILNIVSFIWWIDDVSARAVQLGMKHAYSKQFTFRIIMCLLQISPLVWYVEAILAAIKFRMAEKRSEKLSSYIAMIQAERDAALLRFFEAFLESVPQMLVQGIALTHAFYSLNPSNNFPEWMLTQVVSISFSLLSSCWSFVIQHRSLRLSRPDKENITPSGALMQLLWRIFTVSSRYICFVLFILNYQYWILALFIIHFIISITHISILQPFETKFKNKSVKVGLIVICAAVHFFAPYNMAEGRSRYRYTVAYCIEAIEIVILLKMAMGNERYTLPYKEYVEIGVYLLFLIGIFFMLLYYGCFHPNIVHCHRTGAVSSSRIRTSQIVLSPSSHVMEEL